MRLVHDFFLPQAFIWGLTNYRTSFYVKHGLPEAKLTSQVEEVSRQWAGPGLKSGRAVA
jgi:hypothetical protein